MYYYKAKIEKLDSAMDFCVNEEYQLVNAIILFRIVQKLNGVSTY